MEKSYSTSFYSKPLLITVFWAKLLLISDFGALSLLISDFWVQILVISYFWTQILLISDFRGTQLRSSYIFFLNWHGKLQRKKKAKKMVTLGFEPLCVICLSIYAKNHNEIFNVCFSSTSRIFSLHRPLLGF